MRRTAAVLLSAVLVCVLALLWDLPPPVAEVPVELVWIQPANAAPVANDEMRLQQIEHTDSSGRT